MCIRDRDNLPNGKYNVQVALWHATSNKASMGNPTLNSKALLTVQNGSYTMDVSTHPMTVGTITACLQTLQIRQADGSYKYAQITAKNNPNGQPSVFRFVLPSKEEYIQVKICLLYTSKHEATVNSTRQSKYSTTFGDPSKTEEITVPDEMTFSLIEQEDQEKGAYKLNCTVDFMDNFLGGGDAYPTDITLKVDLDNLMQTEELEALIKATESYAAENYSAESWQNFQEALTAAKAALENAASQAELDNAKQGLEEAITALEPELEQGKYTVPLSLECTVSIPLAPVKEAFSSAFGDTGAINVDNDGSMELIVKNRQMIIDFFSMSTMYANLSDIYYYDETGVKQSVTVKNTIESEYSVGDSVEKIEIPEILSFPLVKQEDGTYRISAYVDYMNKTYDMIINLDFSDCVKLEKTQTLEKEIEEAEAIKAADYTKESYRNLQAAIKTAKSSLIWAQTQEEIELALKDLDLSLIHILL